MGFASLLSLVSVFGTIDADAEREFFSAEFSPLGGTAFPAAYAAVFASDAGVAPVARTAHSGGSTLVEPMNALLSQPRQWGRSRYSARLTLSATAIRMKSDRFSRTREAPLLAANNSSAVQRATKRAADSTAARAGLPPSCFDDFRVLGILTARGSEPSRRRLRSSDRRNPVRAGVVPRRCADKRRG
jgi:hypothetical protein